VSSTFDYIVVGSGAAGSVLADRLTADGKYTVCILEAGPSDHNPFIRIPAGYVKNLNNPELTWQYRSQPSPGTAGRSIYIPQGKVLGGSTSVNGLVYNRGQPEDFDHWATLGAQGWTYNDVLPYFKRSERRIPPDPDNYYRGDSGPLDISDIGKRNIICDAFIDSVASFGVPKNNDYNGKTQTGVGYNQRFIDAKQRRVTAAGAFLKPAMKRPNLTVVTEANVTKIIVEGKRASGVSYLLKNSGSLITVNARKEVILSAGTVNSTRILQLSGIGNAEHLKPLGIIPIHHLPGVGENFQDHYFIRYSARIKSGVGSLNQQAQGWRLLGEISKWLFGKPSALSISPSVAYAFLNSEDIQARSDLQFIFAHGTYKPGKVYELDSFAGATCGFTQQRPLSRGHIRIKSSDPFTAPEIQPNYLQHETDQAVTLRGMKLTRQILHADALKHLFEEEVVPGKQIHTDAELMDFARLAGNTGYHLCGTNKMGPSNDPMAVVGPDLRVLGLDGLRVIDASIMPTVTSANTCAATYMIAEKGADMVLETR